MKMTPLFDFEVNYWLEKQYPTTILKDRYNGCYSGAKWLAFPYDFPEIDPDVCGEDPECMNFWNDYTGLVGKGDTIENAVDNLRLKLMKEAENGFPNSLKLKK